MAFGHAVERRGFDTKEKDVDFQYIPDDSVNTDDDQLKGTKNGDIGDFIDGGGGDDVIIGFAGDDTLIGGDGEDDLSGGAGDDTLVGGILDDDEITGEPTFTQDDYSDDYNAEATFEDNGTDTILGYDDDDSGSGVVDVIDFSDAIDFAVDATDGEKETQLDATLSYEEDPSALGAGELSFEGDVWFNVYSEYDQSEIASTVYVEVDGDVFQWDGSGWDLQENWDLV